MWIEKDILLPEGGVRLFESANNTNIPRWIFKALEMHTPWEQRCITLYGKEIPEPRLTHWVGLFPYTYSGSMLPPSPWTPLLDQLRATVEGFCEENFNGVLLNYYRSASDSIGFHSDNEPELGSNPIIGSMSLGETRTLIFRHKQKKYSEVPVSLKHGSILIMSGDTQRNWNHGILKSKERVGPRINLTFRKIIRG